MLCNDFFLGKEVLEGGTVSRPFRDEFVESGRLLIFEQYCRIHRVIDIGMLSEKLDMPLEEAEKWILNLIRGAKLHAKIDSSKGTVVMMASHPSLYFPSTLLPHWPPTNSTWSPLSLSLPSQV